MSRPPLLTRRGMRPREQFGYHRKEGNIMPDSRWTPNWTTTQILRYRSLCCILKRSQGGVHAEAVTAFLHSLCSVPFDAGHAAGATKAAAPEPGDRETRGRQNCLRSEH